MILELAFIAVVFPWLAWVLVKAYLRSRDLTRALVLLLPALMLAGCDGMAAYQARHRAWLAECIKARPADSDAVYNCSWLWENGAR
jgi:hypothetical protein